MRPSIVLCFAFGCGFASRAASDGGLLGDEGSVGPRDAPALDAMGLDAAALDSAGGGSGEGGASDCFSHWLDGALQFENLRRMNELSDNSAERDPWISDDGLRLYFARTPGEHGASDIYLATRAAKTARFGAPVDLINLNESNDEDRPALSSDELTIVLARQPNMGRARILLARRDQMSESFPSPDETLTRAINADNAAHLDPFLSRDGLRLYLAPIGSTGGSQQIMMAARSSASVAFSAPEVVGGVNRSGASNADPALFDDERVAVFSSTSGGGSALTDLWYATRLTRDDDFRAPALIPGLSSNASDGDPMLSNDGCEIYFSSTRGGARHIWHADVKR